MGGQPPKDQLRFGDLEIDAYSMQVKIGNKALSLTPSEFRLLLHLAQTPGRAIARSELIEVAMPESDAYERAVDIHMANLRRKLKEAGGEDPIDTVRGLGYRFRGDT
ncbi:MAG: winged helix-turn-helix domain-containing protein [Deinococcales bacterium]